MKKFILALGCLLLFSIVTITSRAQSPQAIPYQAVARDANGLTLVNTNLQVRFTFIDSTISTIDYQETQAVNTNSFGLFTANIGQGTPVINTLSDIDWSISGNEYLQVEIDFGGGYVNMGSTRLLSVPFALHAKSASTSADNHWGASGNDIYKSNIGNVGIGTVTPNGALHVASDISNDELVVGENVFNQNDASARIQLGSTTNSALMRIGQSNSNFLSVGWVPNFLDPNLSVGQLSTFNPANALLLQRFGGNLGIGGVLTPQHRVSIGDPSFDVQNIGLRTYTNDANVWKGAGAFGYSSGSVIMGELYGVPTIGGHNADLSGWSNLAINPDGGNVGIGTNNPNHRLEVRGNVWMGNQQPSVFTAVNDAIYLGSPRKYLSNTLGANIDGSVDWINLMSHPLSKGIMFGTSGPNDTDPHSAPTANMVVRSTGEIGIGVAAPEAQLHIYRPGNATNVVIGGSPSSNAHTALVLETSADQSGYSSIQSVSQAGQLWGDLALNSAGGNVGVGTTTPTAKLHVNGSLKINDGTEAAGRVLTSDASGNATWQTPSSGGGVSMGYSSGPGNNPSTTTSFIGVTVTVVITSSSQKIHITASKALGSNAAGGATGLNIYPGYQISGGFVSALGGGIFGLTCAQGQRHTYTVNGAITGLPPGTYQFGMVGSSVNAANWNNNEFGYVSYILSN